MRFRERWRQIWFEPATRSSFIAARTIVCLHALWVLLSRPALWMFAAWPRTFWPTQYPLLLLRFGMLQLPPAAEEALWIVAHCAVIAALFGITPRFSSAVAALLLYHFGPFEEIMNGVYWNGVGAFTLPVFGMLMLSFARHDVGEDPSEEYRWPVTFLRLIVVAPYFLGGLSKLRFTGIAWYTGQNVQKTILEMMTLAHAPIGFAIAQSLTLCWLVSIATFLLEFLSPVALFSRGAGRIFVPAALAAQVLRAGIYGLYFGGWPLLALFVDWDAVCARLAIRRFA